MVVILSLYAAIRGQYLLVSRELNTPLFHGLSPIPPPLPGKALWHYMQLNYQKSFHHYYHYCRAGEAQNVFFQHFMHFYHFKFLIA